MLKLSPPNLSHFVDNNSGKISVCVILLGIIKVYVRKLFKLKNDGKKENETNPNPFDYCRFLKIFIPLVFFFILVFKGGSWVSFTEKNYL